MMCGGTAVDVTSIHGHEERAATFGSLSGHVSQKSNAYEYVGVEMVPGECLLQAAVVGMNDRDAVTGWGGGTFGVQLETEEMPQRAEWSADQDYVLQGFVTGCSSYPYAFADPHCAVPTAPPPTERFGGRRGQRGSNKSARDREKPSCDIINSLPDECLYEIFVCLPRARDRCACAAVCRRWLFLQSHMSMSSFKAKPGRSSSSVEAERSATAMEVPPEDCSSEVRGDAIEGLQGSEPRNDREAKENNRQVITQPQWAIGELSRNLDGRKATDVRLASIAVGTGGRGGLGELAIKGCVGMNVSAVVSDVGLIAIGTLCRALRSLSLWNCPKIGDDGLSAIGRGCKLLDKIVLLKCPEVGDVGLQAVAEGCPLLSSVTLDSCKRIGNTGLKSIGRSCRGLLSLSIINCDIGSEGVQAIVSSCSKLKKMKLEKVGINDSGIALVGEHCKSLVKLRLSSLKNVSEVGFLLFGKKSSSFQELRTICVNACPGLSDNALDVVGKSCRDLKAFSLINCTAVSDLGLKALTMSCLLLEGLHIEACNGITHAGLKAALANRGGGLKTLRLSNCNGVRDKGLTSSDFFITCNTLKSLRITHCMGVGNGCLEMVCRSFPSLEELDLSGLAGVSDRGLKAVIEGVGSKLQSLNLSGCVKVSDQGVCAVVRHCMGNLQRLNLEGCMKVTDRTLKVISAECPVLEELDISKCEITDEGLLTIVAVNGPRLKSLSLAGCKLITDQCLPAIRDACKTLWALNLKQCCGLSRKALDVFESQFYALYLCRS